MTKARFLLLAAFAVCLTIPDSVQANGGGFFPAAPGPVDLAYFGKVKDAHTGKAIDQFPYLAILDKPSSTFIPFDGDAIGHFLSPDIGDMVKQATGKPVDPKGLEIYVFAAGYESVTISRLPRKAKGRVELNVRMVPKPAAGAAGQTSSGRKTWGSTLWALAVGGFAVVAVVGAWRGSRKTSQAV